MLRRRGPTDPEARRERQRVILSFSVFLGSLGKYRFSQQLVNDLLVEPPAPELLIPVLVQAAVCWHWLGSGEAALGFLARAESNVAPGEHRQLAWVLHERASALLSMHQLEQSEIELGKALKQYRLAGDTYGESRALAVGVRLAFERQDLKAAGDAARAARRHAEQHDFGRLRMMRRLDEGRAAILQGDRETGLSALNEALGEAVASQDQVTRFYAHHALWKTHLALGDHSRAALDLEEAKFHVRYVDETTPEAVEIREMRSYRPRGE